MMAGRDFFSPDFLTGFLDLYRQLPCLWDQKSKEYVNKGKKKRAYETLLELLKTIEPDATLEVVKLRIGNIRRAFSREHTKVLKSVASGAAAEEVYVPRLWYYSLMKFLRDSEEVVPTLSTLPRITEPTPPDEAGPSTSQPVGPEELEQEDLSEPPLTQDSQGEVLSHTTSQVPPLVSGRKRARKTHNLEESTISFFEAAKEAFRREVDEAEGFGMFVAAALRKCNQTQQKHAQELMVRLLRRAQEGSLTKDTDLTPQPDSSHPAPPPPPPPPAPLAPPPQQLPPPQQQYPQQPPQGQWQYGPPWHSGDYHRF